MKRLIFIIAIFMTSLAGNAQSTVQTPPLESKMYYSFAWGLFKSKNYTKRKVARFDLENRKNSVPSPLENTKYEQKSALWGAIQWSEKKTASVKTQIDEK